MTTLLTDELWSACGTDAAQAPTFIQRRPPVVRGPQVPGGHPVRAPGRHRLGLAAPGIRRQPQHLLVAVDAWTHAGVWDKVHRKLLTRLAENGGVDVDRVIIDSALVRAVKGRHTGPNPTDRGKPGCKRHVMSDRHGVPLVIVVGPANQRDEQLVKPMSKTVPAGARPRRNGAEKALGPAGRSRVRLPAHRQAARATGDRRPAGAAREFARERAGQDPLRDRVHHGLAGRLPPPEGLLRANR